MHPLAVRRMVGGRFSLASFMAAQSDGLWHDFTKTDRQFQGGGVNSTPVPADDPNEVIGTAFDSRLWRGLTLPQLLAAGTNLVAPGAWQMSVAGGAATATESPNGQLNLTGDGTNAAIGDWGPIATVVGGIYAVTVTVAGLACLLRVGTSKGSNGLQNVSATAGVSSTYYFRATSTTSWVRFDNAALGTSIATNVSVKYIPGYASVQSTGTLKPTFQTTGAKFDGTDDNLLTSYLAGGAANFLVARVTVPASIAAVQVAAGAQDASSNRLFIAFDTNGVACGGLAAANYNVIRGAIDRRSTEVVIGISCDGATVRLFDDAAIAYEAAQSGSINTTVPLRIGSHNASGSASSFFGGSVKKLVTGREFLTLARYLQIRNALLAA